MRMASEKFRRIFEEALERELSLASADKPERFRSGGYRMRAYIKRIFSGAWESALRVTKEELKEEPLAVAGAPTCQYECQELAKEWCRADHKTERGARLTCTRLKGHAGKHSACSINRHALVVW